ncbi:Hypothetical predicted protein [Pelobates cultripes]|uniref:Ubiquitin-like protease family profile domain-containing protein n=1 Tax=Pelobates cultripes TaxID=61616 RepID=A0AAD1WLD8_PELCU|nr:Hypothetical predicted protein [Pelobates cultripes]
MEKIKENIEKAQEKQKMTYEKKVLKKHKDVVYSAGNEVLLYNMRKRGRKGGRIEPDFSGPYIIKEVCGKVVKLANSDGVTLKNKISIDHIKPYRRSEESTVHRQEGDAELPEEISTCVSSILQRTSVICFAAPKKESTIEVVIMSKKAIALMDLMGNENSYISKVQRNWNIFLRMYKPEEQAAQWSTWIMFHSNQQDFSSCGVLILMFAKEFLWTRTISEVKTSAEYITDARLEIACALLQLVVRAGGKSREILCILHSLSDGSSARDKPTINLNLLKPKTSFSTGLLRNTCCRHDVTFIFQ